MHNWSDVLLLLTIRRLLIEKDPTRESCFDDPYNLKSQSLQEMKKIEEEEEEEGEAVALDRHEFQLVLAQVLRK